jgi:hypothetical protein
VSAVVATPIAAPPGMVWCRLTRRSTPIQSACQPHAQDHGLPWLLRRHEHAIALDCYSVGLLDGTQAGRDPGLAGGDGLAVAAAVGTFGLALLDCSTSRMWVSLVGVRGDGEHGAIGGRGIENQGDRPGLSGNPAPLLVRAEHASGLARSSRLAPGW